MIIITLDEDILFPGLTLNGQNILMHGLYDGEFVGFKIASSEQLDTALREAVVAVDANVLLDLYRFRPQTSQDLIKTFKSLGDRLVVPHQALREFWRRRQRSQDSPRGATKVATDALAKSDRSISDALATWAKAVGPLYGFVVSINLDTLYASFYLDLSQGPQIFTIPKTGVTYSLLTLDLFGDVFKTSIQPQTPGTYGLVPAGRKGTLPPGVTKVQVPYPVTTWIIRADKYSSTNQNQTDQASAFRASLRLASLPAYEQDPLAGATKIYPQAAFALRTKAIADDMVRFNTTQFFRIVQAALRSPATAPLSKSDLQLSRAFNRLFAAANIAARHGNLGPLSQMIRGARTAHAMIIDRWLSHADPNHWIYFSNFADWGKAYLDRAAGNEYIQYGNNASAAGYYNAFTDGSGTPLNGAVTPAYRLTFSKKQLPQANRFWSLTAYLPRGNTLVPNAARKYEVARFTPGLVTNPDGSITIYIQTTPPAKALRPNWLPVPRGPFDVLLRVYGPEGNTSPGAKYIPPKIQR